MENKLPKGWVWFDMLDLIDYEGGSQPPKKEFIYEPKKGYVRLLQIRDFGDKPFPTFVPDSKRLKKVEEDDLLIARYGGSSSNDSLGRICSGIKGAYNVALAKVIYSKKDFAPGFVKYLLSGPWFKERLASLSRSCQTGFNREDLQDLLMPLPPPSEQVQIVAKLDAIMQKVEANKQRLGKVPKLLKRFRQAVLAAAVSGRLTEEWREENESVDTAKSLVLQIKNSRNAETSRKSKDVNTNDFTTLDEKDIPPNWILTSIGEVTECLDYKRRPINKTERLRRQGDIPYYGANGQVGWIDNYIFDEDLVVIVEDETFIGREIPFSYIIRGKTWVNNHAHVLRPLGGISVEYLNICWAFYDFTPLTTGTTGRRKLNQGALLNAKFPLAPLQEQKEIVKRVGQLFAFADKIEARYLKAKTMLDRLPQSILGKAFRGELS